MRRILIVLSLVAFIWTIRETLENFAGAIIERDRQFQEKVAEPQRGISEDMVRLSRGIREAEERGDEETASQLRRERDLVIERGEELMRQPITESR